MSHAAIPNPTNIPDFAEGPANMTSTVSTATAAAPRTRSFQGKQTFMRAVRSEWIKIWTLRSTWISAALTVLITAGFGALFTSLAADPDFIGLDDPGTMLNAGTFFGMIVVAVLGTMSITGEYSSGQIRSSLAAVPGRLRLLTAKALVSATVGFLLGSVSIFLAWLISLPFLGDKTISLADSHYSGLIWGTGLSYAIIVLMSMGLGFLLRSTAGSITIVTVLLFVINLPLSIAAAFWEWPTKVLGLLPSTVFYSVADPMELSTSWADTSEMSTYFLEHWQATLVFCAWGLILLLIGAIVFSRRNA